MLAPFKSLAQVQIATSKMTLDIQDNNFGTRSASPVAEGLKTQDLRKLGYVRKMLNLSGQNSQCPVFLPEINLDKSI